MRLLRVIPSGRKKAPYARLAEGSKKLPFVVLSFLLIFIYVFQLNAFSQEDSIKLKKDTQIIVDGDKVEFFDKEKRVVAEGNVSVKYGDITLTCDKIEVDMQAQKASCLGNVRIVNEEGEMRGDHIIYDFINKKGEIIGAEVKAFPWFGQAAETRRVSENEYVLKNGTITTCDLDVPHYTVRAQEIRVFPDEKIIAKNAFVYIGNMPVLWFPYYYHPIIESRAKVQFVPGQSTEWGYFLLSAWRFYVKGNTKVDVLADYRTKKGFAEGANFYYYADDLGLNGLGEGLFRSYFIHQNDTGTYETSEFRDEGLDPELRKRFQWFHRIDFDPSTVGVVQFNWLSDEFVLKDYFFNEYEENNQVPQNNVFITSYKDNYTFSIDVEKRFNDFYTVTEKLPEVKLDVYDQRLWETPFYYTNQMSGTVFQKEYAFQSQPSEKVERYDTLHKLSYLTKIGFLNLTPFGTVEETVYSQNKWGDEFVSRIAFSGGVDAYTRFSKIYDVKSDFAGIDINGLRHIIEPSARYFHRHQPTVDRENLFQLDEIDTLQKENSVGLTLENRLQTKRLSGDTYKSVDLARFIVNTDYFFSLQKGEIFLRQERKFGDVKFDLELNPYSWLSIDSEMAVNPKKEAMKTGSVEVALTPSEKFRMALGYRYEKAADNTRNQFTYDIEYILNPKWRLGWYERFNFQRTSIEEQQFTVVRDLHCWEVEVSYNVRGSDLLKDEHIFWLAFKIKAFPDLPIGLSRSFVKRPPGSINR